MVWRRLQHAAPLAGVTSRPPDLASGNPTTISAIQNKRHIESVHSFFDMSNPARGENIMAWTTPRIVEIAVGMEINTYACAGL